MSILSRPHIEDRLLNRMPDAEARSDADLTPYWDDLMPKGRVLRPAAVLVPLVERPSGLTVLLTERSAELPSHAGQVAFPGGRIDDTDHGPEAAALREAEEEVGLNPAWTTLVGRLDHYHTGTGFRITPIVGFVEPAFTLNELVLEEAEVAKVFEVPLSFLMDPSNHEKHAIDYKGRERIYYAMPYQGHYIWGATAGMLVNMSHILHGTMPETSGAA